MKRPSSISKSLLPLVPSEVYDTYWRFAAERQEVFRRRMQALPPPWTQDSIIQRHKFTNVYRATDRVSQYLIRHVIYEGEQSVEEIFFRVLLFKLFNKIETWELLKSHSGSIEFRRYSFENYDSILSRAFSRKISIYSGAYIMPSGRHVFNEIRKHRTHLRLLEVMMKDDTPSRVAGACSLKEVYSILLSYPLIGPFLAYQYAIDLNYSTIIDFAEGDFVVAGPGARDGIAKCFRSTSGLSAEDIIRIVAERQEYEFARLGLKFGDLWGRPLQLIDCQNIFCEVDKYARLKHPNIVGITGRKRIKQKFSANTNRVTYWFPPKWGINDRIQGSEVPFKPKRRT